MYFKYVSEAVEGSKQAGDQEVLGEVGGGRHAGRYHAVADLPLVCIQLASTWPRISKVKRKI